MNKEYRIEKITDLLAFGDDEIERLIPDLLVWIVTARAMGQDVPGLTHQGMIWVDDGKPGEIHHIQLTDSDGKTTRYPGPASREAP